MKDIRSIREEMEKYSARQTRSQKVRETSKEIVLMLSDIHLLLVLKKKVAFMFSILLGVFLLLGVEVFFQIVNDFMGGMLLGASLALGLLSIHECFNLDSWLLVKDKEKVL